LGQELNIKTFIGSHWNKFRFTTKCLKNKTWLTIPRENLGIDESKESEANR